MSFASKARLALATLTVGGATLAATTAVTTTPADAHRRLIIRTGFIYRAPIYVVPRHVVPVTTLTVVGNSCAVYRWRAEAYNSVYWWERYKDCKGY